MAPPITETVTIINKSGKVVSTGKQLVNIFKDAKAAYQEKKAQLKEEHYLREEARSYRAQRRLDEARYEIEEARGGGGDDAQSIASRRSHRSHRSHRSQSSRQEPRDSSRPPLTINNYEEFPDAQSLASGRSHRSHRSHTRTRQEFNFDDLDEEEDMQSLASKRSHRSHRSKRSRSVHGSKAPTQYEPTETHYEDPEEGFYDDPPLAMYRQPFAETELSLARRHTEMEAAPPMPGHLVRRETAPATYTSGPLVPRATSVPDLHDDSIDMDLAYGDAHHFESDPEPEFEEPIAPQQLPAELDETMSKLDTLLIEAQCLHHTATAIMSNLQANPEAMAAVALTLAELSSLLTKMSPSIIPMLKASSPAIFALLASPQFLIAGGVALGVTVVMFNGFKIIKKLQATPEKPLEAPMAMQALPATPNYPDTPGFMEPQDMHHEYEEAMPYEAYEEELSSIDIWRRGIADAEIESVGTSVDGEYITPTAARQKESRHAERIRQRAAEERIDESEEEEEEEKRSIMSRLTSKSRRSKTLPIRGSPSQYEPSVKSKDDDIESIRTSRTKTSKSTKSSKSHRSSRSKKDDDNASLASERTERTEKEEKEPKEKKKKTPLSIFRSKTEKSTSFKGKEKESKKMGHHPLLLEL